MRNEIGLEIKSVTEDLLHEIFTDNDIPHQAFEPEEEDDHTLDIRFDSDIGDEP